MLSIAKMGQGSAFYYANLAQEQEEYDLRQPGEPPARWMGKGAFLLGLSGCVKQEDFLSLFAGYAPKGESLVRNAGQDARVPGWDLTFAPPKSVSLLWALSPEEIRSQIEAAHERAVASALSYLENYAYIRLGEGGYEYELEKANLVVATYQHGTNRNQEPFLHSHALVLNVGITPEGRGGALYSRPLYRNKMTAGALYRADLAASLQRELGLELERISSWFEIKGFSRNGGRYQELMNLWSSRRQEIEAQNPQTAQAAQIAAYQTRQAKQKLPPRAKLLTQWQEIGRQYGLGQKQISRLIGKPLERMTIGQKWQEWRIIRQAATQVVRRESHFSRRELVRAMAEAAQNRGIDAKGILRLTEKYLASRQVMSLGLVRDEERFTTKRLWKLERQILTQVKRLDQKRSRFRVSNHKVLAAARKQRLSYEQQEALKSLTSRGRIKTIAGISGTGKTYTLKAARYAFEQSGYQVLGLSVSKRGAERLKEQTGIGKQGVLSQALFGKEQRTKTLSRLFWDIDRARESQRKYGLRSVVKPPLSRQTVVVVDSAQEISAVQMKRLLDEGQSAGAKLILAGDLRQSPAYEHGGAFRAVALNLKTPELGEVKRQQTERGRDVVQKVSRGKTLLALRRLNEQGHLSISDSREAAIKALVERWAEQGGAKHPRAHLLIAEEQEESQQVNRLVQRERQQQGCLGRIGVRVGEERIYKGDRVRLAQTSRTYGVAKGELGQVRHIDPVSKVAVVRLDRGKLKAINLRHYKGMELGYCLVGSQARNVETRHAYVLSRGIYGREGAAIQLSRATVETYLQSYQLEPEEKAMWELARKMEWKKNRDFAHVVREPDREQKL